MTILEKAGRKLLKGTPLLSSDAAHGESAVLVVVVLRVDIATRVHEQVVAVVSIVDGRRPPVAA